MLERFQQYQETELCRTALDAYRRFLDQYHIARPVLVVDHEGVLLPFNFHHDIETEFDAEDAVRQKANHLPVNSLILDLIQHMAGCEPSAQVMSGSQSDTCNLSLPGFSWSYRYGWGRGHELLGRITKPLSPADPLPEDSTLFFINDRYDAVYVYLSYLKKMQPHYDSLTGVPIEIPKFTGTVDETAASECVHKIITGLTQEPKTLKQFSRPRG